MAIWSVVSIASLFEDELVFGYSSMMENIVSQLPLKGKYLSYHNFEEHK